MTDIRVYYWEFRMVYNDVTVSEWSPLTDCGATLNDLRQYIAENYAIPKEKVFWLKINSELFQIRTTDILEYDNWQFRRAGD